MMHCKIVCLICLFWMSAAAGYAQTPDLQQLKAKLQQLDQMMQFYPSLRGFFRLPGTGTLVKLGDFVKTDTFVDANQAGTYYGGYVPSSFPSSPRPHTVNTGSMRPSRFIAEFRQPAGDDCSGTVKTHLESPFSTQFGTPVGSCRVAGPDRLLSL